MKSACCVSLFFNGACLNNYLISTKVEENNLSFYARDIYGLVRFVRVCDFTVN